MRLAFFGLPLAALLLLEDGHDVLFAVLSRKDMPGRRRLTRLLGQERVHLRDELGERELLTQMRALEPDLLVSWFYTAKLPISLVRAAKHGGIGVHPSLLPRHRGPDPYFAAIDQGDRITGVTVHRIEAEYDTGAMLARRELEVGADWNAWQLARKLDRPSLELLRETVRRFSEGKPIDEEAQDESNATLEEAPSDDDCEIVWSWPVDRILRRIRALAPTPGAFTEIGGEIVTIFAARRAGDFPRALAPGEAATQGGVAVVRAADGAIELLHGEIDGQMQGPKELAETIARSRDLVP